MGKKKVLRGNTSDINQSYTISVASVLPSPTPYAKGIRKDKNIQVGNGSEMAERPQCRK